MTTKKSGNFDKTKGVLVIAIGVLVLTLLAIIVTYPKAEGIAQDDSNANELKGSIAQLGALEYDFTGDKAVKRTDAHLMNLKSFLVAEGEKSLGPNCSPVYHNVMMSSPDERQVLLNYGCSYPNARMFAVRQDEEWKLISPTNQFDTFGIPLCTHVDENGIDQAIAPVCADEDDINSSQLVYRVR